jgi:hypothetical protein
VKALISRIWGDAVETAPAPFGLALKRFSFQALRDTLGSISTPDTIGSDVRSPRIIQMKKQRLRRDIQQKFII